MADKPKVRHLPTSADTPVAQPDPLEKFAADLGKALTVYDNLIVVCCRGGYIIDVMAMRDNRHEIRGVLGEVAEVYDDMTNLIEFGEE